MSNQPSIQSKVNEFLPQMQEILIHAKSIGFCFETGNMDDLMRSWIQSGLKFQNAYKENKSQFAAIVKKKCGLK